MPRVRRRILALGTLLLGVGCAPAPPPQALPVLELSGKTLTVTDLEGYLDANLQAPAELGDAQDLDQVKSRLFDNFVDEEVLFAEAERQGIQVGEEEISAYLRNSSEDQAPGPPLAKRRPLARRELLIEKLRERMVRDRVSVTPDDVDAYLLQHRTELPPRRHLVLRSLLVPSETRAKQLYAQIRSHELSFDEAVVASGSGEGQGEPLEVELDGLPAQVQGALAGLAPGQVSAPVLVQGSCYLFFVLSSASPSENEEEVRRRARDELLRQRHEQASRQLLEDLKSRVRPRIEVGNLPFHYLPEDDSSGRGAASSSRLQ